MFRDNLAFTTTATVDGEPATVERMPERKCSRCGRRDPLTAAYRAKYQEAFDQATLVLPEGICDECAKGLWNKRMGSA
jgi:hypothetical protein